MDYCKGIKTSNLNRRKQELCLVSNIRAAKKNLEAGGVKIIGDIRDDSYGALLTLEDVNGHWLEFFEPKPKA